MAARPPMLEAVPNVSVGRDRALLDRLVTATRAGAVEGSMADDSRAELVDVHCDSDHDRSVLTIVGWGGAVTGALDALARAAVDLMNVHSGEGVHPRSGVLDVLPVIALESGGDAFAVRDHVAATLGALGVPVVAYGKRVNGGYDEEAIFAGQARRGGPEVVCERIALGELEQLAGPAQPHPTAGVTVAGVRNVLIAFNVDLATDDLAAARVIARRIRESAGHEDALPGVRALGLQLQSRNVVQVSTNVERHATCGPERVLRMVASIAKELGIEVGAAELVGLAPETALAPLRYRCTALGIALHAAPGSASLEDAIAALGQPH